MKQIDATTVETHTNEEKQEHVFLKYMKYKNTSRNPICKNIQIITHAVLI